MKHLAWAALCLALATALGTGIGVAPVPTTVAAAVVLGVTLGWAARTRQRTFLSRPRRVPAGVDYVPEFVLLPLAVSVRQSTLIAILLVGLLAAASLRRRAWRPVRLNGPALALLGVTIIVFRSAQPADLVLLLCGVVFLAMAAARRNEPRAAIESLMLGLVVYIWANIVAWFAGISSPAASVRLAGFESSSGIFGERVLWPFARSINEAPIVAGILFAFIAATFMQGYRPRRWHWAGLLGGAVILLGANSRFPLIVAVAVVAAVLVAPVVARRALLPVALVVLSAPFYAGALYGVLLSGARILVQIPYLARGQSITELAGLGTRGTIWDNGLAWWTGKAEPTAQAIGYGQNGHATSGAVYTYYDLFGGFLSSPVALTLHNSFLQTMFDAGYVGLALLVAGLAMTMLSYLRSGSTAVVAALGVAYLSAATEVVLAPGASTTPFLLVLVLAILAPPLRQQLGVDASGGPAAGESRVADGRRQVGLAAQVECDARRL